MNNLENFLQEKKNTLKTKGEITLQCKIKTNAKTCCFRDLLLDQQTLLININKPPLEGKANKELIKFLSNYFGVAKSFVSIRLGRSSGMKVIRIVNQY